MRPAARFFSPLVPRSLPSSKMPLTPVFATDPKDRLVSPLLATHPRPPGGVLFLVRGSRSAYRKVKSPGRKDEDFLFSLMTYNSELTTPRGGHSRRGLGALAGVAGEAKEGEIQAGGGGVLVDVLRREVLADIGAGLGHERFHGGIIARGGPKNFHRHFHPAVQALAKLRDVRRGIVGIAKMRQEHALRFAFQNGGEGAVPDLQVDVRRRSGGHRVGVSLDFYACSVAYECHSFGILEIADVMRSVPGRVGDFDFARAERNGLSAFEDAKIL